MIGTILFGIVAFFSVFVFGILVGSYVGSNVVAKRIEALSEQHRDAFEKALDGYLLPVVADQARSLAELRGRSNVLTALTLFFGGERFEWRLVDIGEKPERVYGYEWHEQTKSFVYPLPTHIVTRYGSSVAPQQHDRRADSARFN